MFDLTSMRGPLVVITGETPQMAYDALTRYLADQAVIAAPDDATELLAGTDTPTAVAVLLP